MKLFKKKSEVKETNCCCSEEVEETKEESCCCCNDESGECCCNESEKELKSIKVLGSGCKSCHALYNNAKEAVTQAALNVELEYVTDLEKIMSYGVMSTPALVFNEQVVSMGKVLKPQQIIDLLERLGFEK